jgi:hypothetical protein
VPAGLPPSVALPVVLALAGVANEPLPPEHFTSQEREEAASLGDGSPALDPRGGRNGEDKGEDETAPERADQ